MASSRTLPLQRTQGVRREAGGVLGQPRLGDAGAELLAEVEREVQEVHAVREPARRAHGGRAAGALGVVVGIRPELERHRRQVAPVAGREQRGMTALSAAAHGDEHAVGALREHRVGADRLAERAVQRVGREVGRVELAGAEASQLGGDVRRADPGRVEDVRAVRELDGGGCGGQHGAASWASNVARAIRSPSTAIEMRTKVAASSAARRAVVGGGGPGPRPRVARGDPRTARPRRVWERPTAIAVTRAWPWASRGRSRSRPGRGPA